MARRFFPQQGLRSRLIILSAAPSLICLLVTVVVASWLVRDLHQDLSQRALQAAGQRFDARLAEMRGRLERLARGLEGEPALLSGHGEEPGAAGLRGLFPALQAAEPLLHAIELRSWHPGEAARTLRAEAGCGTAGCATSGLPLVEGLARLPRPGGGGVEVRLTAVLGQGAMEEVAASEGGAVLLFVNGQPRLGTLALALMPVSRWVPDWLRTAMAEGRPAIGPMLLGGRSWMARAMPLPGAEPGAEASLVLLLPSVKGALTMDETLGIVVPAFAAILILGTVYAAGAARRLGEMLSGLTEALHRLSRGDLTVLIPPPPQGAPREVAELTDACILFRDASAERSRLSERLRWLANFDGLTGLPNRALLGDRLELAFAAARRDGTCLAVLAMDLDHFKEVNDTLGHAAGDEVLRVVAARLRGCLRATDTLARVGGDEFVLVAPELGRPEALTAFAARLLAAMEEPVALGSEFRTVGLSIGAAVLEPGAFEGRPEAMLQDADLALYQAKAEGGCCLRVFEPEMDEQLRTRRLLIADLRNAMARQELTILFQPQVSTATRRIKGAEALLRWHHPQRGMISPDIFIPLAEETGLIVPIGAWVLEEACQMARSWGGLNLAVNVSAIQVRQASFVATVEGALARSGLPPDLLELEITEAAMLANSAETLGILSRLRSLGVRLAMDDFGTGYSSLATLQRFRFDKIKVDRSFIRHIGRDAKAVALLRAVIALGSALDVTTNAEGVEDEGQLSMLRAEGCEEAQGFLFGRPMSAADFQARLGQQEARAA